MGISLSAITNVSLPPNHGKAYYDAVQQKLQALNLSTTYIDHNGKECIDDIPWHYYKELVWLESKKREEEVGIVFENPTWYTPTLYPEVGYIMSGHRYGFLFDSSFYQRIRPEIEKLVKALGGTEVIWLSDAETLWKYEELAYGAETSYEAIKALMLKELGPPITQYSALDPNNDNHYFLDRFDMQRHCNHDLRV